MPVRKFVFMAVALFWVACSGNEAEEQTIRGTITYLPKIALHADTRVIIQMYEKCPNEERPQKVQEQVIIKTIDKEVLDFAMMYRAQDLDTTCAYALRAEMREQGRLSFLTQEPYFLDIENIEKISPKLVLVKIN